MAGESPQMFGRYQILKPLGEGGMGAVYLARDSQLDRLVALKVPKLEQDAGPDSESVKRFFREARAAATLNHPNICPIHDVGEVDGTPFLTMAYIQGQVLSSLVSRDGPMDQRRAAEIVRTLALAMEEAHGRGVIHRDLKPSNVMMTARGEPVVMDFGLARRDESVESRLTQSGAVLGTPAFMAPEQLRGDPRAIGRAADVYALGVVLYQLLTARLPFQGSVMSMLAQILYEAPMPPSRHRGDLDRKLEAICLKAMAKEPMRRYATMAAFAASLEKWLDVGPGVPSPQVQGSPVAGPPQSALARHRGFLAGGAVCALVLLLGYVITEGFSAGWVMIVLSDPAAAVEVVIDGRPVEHARLAEPMRLRSGEHHLLVSGDDYQTLSRTFTVKSGPNPPLHVALAAPRQVLEKAVPDRSPPAIAASQGAAPAASEPAKAQARAEQSPPSAPGPSHPATASPPARPTSAVAAVTPRDVPPAHLEAPSRLTNSIGMKFVLIPAGEFLMGSTDADKDAFDSEKPQHRVRITRPIYLGMHEVTRGQFRRFVDEAGYRTEAERDGKGGYGWNEQRGSFEQDPRYTWLETGFEQTDEHPVVNVSWNDAAAFAEWLSRKEGKAYRLPTEAEWEYACRAGTTTRYAHGDDPEGLAEVGNVADGTAKARYPDWPTIAAQDGFVYTSPVGRYRPNAWGLHDMHGNVWEWCRDGYDANFYKIARVDDPAGPLQASERVIRGGSWCDIPRRCRSGYRSRDGPGRRSFSLGFRLAAVQSGR